MKTDRELLELAANAAGIGPVIGYAAEAGELMIGPRNNIRYWNPLARDGQALRLAVKLHIGLAFDGDCDSVIAGLDLGVRVVAAHQLDDVGTRRAIVRAAAAIGEAMQ